MTPPSPPHEWGYCPEAHLVVEIDGESHVGRAEHDARRTRWLEARDMMVLRFPAEEVRVNLDAVLDFIALKARERIRG